MQSASAISSMHITADSVTHDTATAQKLELVVDLASTTVTAKATHIQYQTIEARNANILLNYRVVNSQSQPSLTLNTDLKQNTDKSWAKAQARCLLPKNLVTETWDCSDGKFTAERINLPFNLSVLPQAKGFIANIQLQNANFSDEAGLHAAEKLNGHLTVVAKHDGDTLNFNSALNWQNIVAAKIPRRFAN